MQVHALDSLDWLYADSQAPEMPRRAVLLHSARNARPGFQILVTGVAGGTPLRVAAAPLKRKGGGALAGARTFHLLHVPVEENTGAVGFTHDGDKNPYVTRRAPFRVYDAMRPMGKESPALAGANALLIQYPVPASARPGAYEGAVKVRAGTDEAEVSVALQVHKAQVPARGSLKVTNWFTLDLMAERHGLTKWSPAHWRMIRRYADLMASNRQTMFWAPVGLIQMRQDRGGRWSFDFRRWTRLIRTFLDAGFTWIEGGHIAHRKEWAATRYHTGKTYDLFATDAAGHAFLAALLPALLREVERNGWRDIYVQHVSDEPHGADVPDYRILCGMVRRLMPGVPLIDATCTVSMPGALDIWVPQNWTYEKGRADWEAHRAAGDELWHYTCCFPGGQYLNRLLDQSLLRPRLLHWGNYHYDLPGFLHWGLNHYRPEQDPLEMSVVGHGGNNKLPAGDTHIVYPGADGPWSSMRFEAEREGCEDYELLRAVARRHRKVADRITRQVFRGFADYTEDSSTFRRAHRQLLQAASRG